MSNRSALEFFAWYGVAAVLVAYALLNMRIFTPEDPLFLFLNLSGSVGVGIHAFTKRDYQPVVTNVIWIVITLFGLMNALY